MQREPGFYWVKTLPNSDWEPAKHVGNDEWFLVDDCDVYRGSLESFSAIGPRITPPEEK